MLGLLSYGCCLILNNSEKNYTAPSADTPGHSFALTRQCEIEFSTAAKMRLYLRKDCDRRDEFFMPMPDSKPNPFAWLDGDCPTDLAAHRYFV